MTQHSSILCCSRVSCVIERRTSSLCELGNTPAGRMPNLQTLFRQPGGLWQSGPRWLLVPAAEVNRSQTSCLSTVCQLSSCAGMEKDRGSKEEEVTLAALHWRGQVMHVHARLEKPGSHSPCCVLCSLQASARPPTTHLWAKGDTASCYLVL